MLGDVGKDYVPLRRGSVRTSGVVIEDFMGDVAEPSLRLGR